MMHRFPTRAAALRSLKDISIDAIQHAKQLITEEDDMFCFDEDAAEQYLNSQSENNLEIAMTTSITNVKTATTAQLVEFYNDHAESSIKKFRDRATAEARCQAILDAIAADEAKPVTPPEKKIGGMTLAETVAFAKSVAEKKGKIAKAEPVKLAEVMKPNMGNPLVEEKQQVTEEKLVEEVSKVEGERAPSVTQADTMKTSLKLDRTIVATWKTAEGNECSGEWKNAYQMWKANPTWMTSSQQDTLTAKLYAAAKKGDKITVEINGRAFELLNV